MNQFEHSVAFAEQALENAELRHQEAQEDVANIRGKIDAVNQRRESIKADLRAGNLDDRAAGGLLGVADEDLADLNQLLVKARADCENAVPTREQQALVEAQASLERHRRESEFDALSRHAADVEATLIGVIAELYQRGRDLGRPSPLSASWRPSQALDQALRLGTPPKVAR